MKSGLAETEKRKAGRPSRRELNFLDEVLSIAEWAFARFDEEEPQWPVRRTQDSYDETWVSVLMQRLEAAYAPCFRERKAHRSANDFEAQRFVDKERMRLQREMGTVLWKYDRDTATRLAKVVRTVPKPSDIRRVDSRHAFVRAVESACAKATGANKDQSTPEPVGIQLGIVNVLNSEWTEYRIEGDDFVTHIRRPAAIAVLQAMQKLGAVGRTASRHNDEIREEAKLRSGVSIRGCFSGKSADADSYAGKIRAFGERVIKRDESKPGNYYVPPRAASKQV